MSHGEGSRILSSKRSNLDSNDHFVALVHAELLKSPYPPLRTISCHAANGALVLAGSVPSYYLKQLTQRLAMNTVAGRLTIDNQLRVEE
jgi:hypothetical protein